MALVVLGELFEFFGCMHGTKSAGANWCCSIAAIAGAVAGAIISTYLIPELFLRTVPGACIGTGLATWSLELSRGRKMDESVRCVVSAGFVELLGDTTKVTVGIIIWLLVAITAFWP